MPALEQIVVRAPLLTVGCTLGEAPLFDPATSVLHFVDISEKRVHHLDTHSLALTSEQYDDAVTCLALRQSGPGLACTATQGFALIEGDSTLNYLCKPIPESERPYTRFNDGACDVDGRFFAGTIRSTEPNVPGKLYMFDSAAGKCEVVDAGPFTDSNGLGFSPDGKTMYFTDSLVNHIHAYDYEGGSLSNRRLFIDPISQGQPEKTYPDGLCLDSEGGIWSARWGASRIIRYKPDGSPHLEVIFPTALNVTACCFGGFDEDQLYVTTAHCGAVGGDASRQTHYPDSGHLFTVDLSGRFRGGKWRYAFAG